MSNVSITPIDTQIQRTLMSSRIVVFPILQKFKELFCATLFEKTHQRALDSLHLGARDLGNLAITVNETACDLFKLEITGDIGVHEDLGKFTRSDDELGYKVNSIVSVASELLRG